MQGRATKLADPAMRTSPTGDSSEQLHLSALQLAFWRGDTRTTQFVIEQRSQVQWRWGPLTSVATPLDEIDSAGDGGNDLMQLVTMYDCPLAAQMCLDDKFMDGFLFNLFVEKWHRFARRQHWAKIVLDLSYLVLMLINGVALKHEPLTADRVVIPSVLVLLGTLEAGLDVATLQGWMRERLLAGSSLKQARGPSSPQC